jgi:hypothetical protein
MSLWPAAARGCQCELAAAADDDLMRVLKVWLIIMCSPRSPLVDRGTSREYIQALGCFVQIRCSSVVLVVVEAAWRWSSAPATQVALQDIYSGSILLDMMTSAVLFLTLFLIISMHTITSVVVTMLEHQAITLEEAAAAPNTSTRNSTSTTTTRERVAAAELEIMMGTRAAAHGRDGQRRLLQHVFGRPRTSRRRPLKLVQSIRRRRSGRSRLQQEQQLPGRRRLEDHSGAAGDKKGFGSVFGSNYRLIPTGPDPLHNWDFILFFKIILVNSIILHMQDFYKNLANIWWWFLLWPAASCSNIKCCRNL